jgi:hypothetical protein
VTAPEYAFIASDAARARVRGAVAALNALGYDARHYGADSAQARRAKAVVFCDVRPDTARFVYDVVDDRNLQFAEGAYAITCPSVALAQVVAPRLGRAVEVVPEPLEGVRREPRVARAKPRSRPLEWLARRAGLATDIWRTQLLWAGDKADVETIVGAYPALKQLGAEHPLTLHCVATPEVLDALREQVREDGADAVRLSFDVASSQVLSQALEACDFLLLPREARLQRAAVQAGRHAIVGDDPCAAIRQALAQPRETLESLQRAQQELDEAHAPAVVARAWVRIFMRGSR